MIGPDHYTLQPERWLYRLGWVNMLAAALILAVIARWSTAPPHADQGLVLMPTDSANHHVYCATRSPTQGADCLMTLQKPSTWHYQQRSP